MIAEGEWARIVDVKSITLTDHGPILKEVRSADFRQPTGKSWPFGVRMGREGVFFWRIAMRIRADSVFISSVLFTVALLGLIRPALWCYFSGSDKVALAKLDVGFRAE